MFKQNPNFWGQGADKANDYEDIDSANVSTRNDVTRSGGTLAMRAMAPLDSIGNVQVS